MDLILSYMLQSLLPLLIQLLLGAFMGGYLFDLFARYSEMWWAAFATAVLAGVMVFFVKENRPQRGLILAPAT